MASRCRARDMQVGQEFHDHADFFYIDQPYWAEYEPHGGQRTWTAMAYLAARERRRNRPFRCSTSTIEPRLGRLLIWNNMALDGSPNRLDPARRVRGRSRGANISSPNGIASGRSSDAGGLAPTRAA